MFVEKSPSLSELGHVQRHKILQKSSALQEKLCDELTICLSQAKRLSLFGVSNKLRSKAQRAAAVPRFVAEVMPHIAAGRIRARVDQVFDFTQLPQAKLRMESGAHIGKIVLRIAPGDRL